MDSLILLIAAISALLSLILIKQSASSYFVAIAGSLSIYPLLKTQHSILIVAILMLLASFEYLSSNQIRWDKRMFTPIKQTRFKLFLMLIILVTGFSLAWWSSGIWPAAKDTQIAKHWWKLFLMLALSIHLLTLLKRYKGKNEQD